MKTRFISILLILSLTVGVLSGCSAGAAPTEAALTPNAVKPLGVDLSDPADVGLSEFDSMLIEFLKQTGKAQENFVVSPLSLRAALALAASGLDGDTRDKLLAAMGFASQEEMDAWYQQTTAGSDLFAEFSRSPYGSSSGAAYEIVNSVWRNESLPGAFQEAYRELVEQTYRAELHSASSDQITDEINSWVNEKTKGLIPKIVANAADSAVVLVNAIYLRNAWIEAFKSSPQTEFTALDGKVVEKSFMEREDRFDYYEDENCQIVVIPMNGGMSMVCVLGDDTGFSGKLNQTQSRLVRVVLPKFDVETSYDDNELGSFLATVGCEKLFTGEADFSRMYTGQFFVDGIIQKAKVKIDEEGIEAAAATAIITKGAMPLQPEDPALFLADRAFSFYVLDGSENPNVLFWGQIVN